MTRYFRPAIDAMVGYTPGEQPPPGTPIIKLNTNENPYPPSPRALDVLRSLDPEWLRRYPDPYVNEVRSAVSEVLAVPPEWVLVGNGSDDVLNVVIRACAEGDRRIVYPMPTYVLYRTLGQMQAAEWVEVPYGEDFQLPIAELVAAQGVVTLIATPNSPSGHAVPLSDLKQLAAQVSGVLVIDEAYVDFADETVLPLVREFDNVIVMRTLSKGYSLAGLRLGFGIANPGLLSGLFKVRDSYSVDAIATHVAAAAIRDQDYKNACVEKVKASRSTLSIALKELGFQVWPSQANFVQTRPPRGNAEELYLALKQRGILVRYFNQAGLTNKLRITVGTDEQNQQLVAQLRKLI